MDFISDLGHNLTWSTSDPRESSFLFQRLSISVQRFNAVAFREPSQTEKTGTITP